MATIIPFLKQVNGQYVLTKIGESTVYLKYIHKSKHILTTTGVRVAPSCWDYSTNPSYPVTGSGKEKKNQLIQQKRDKLNKIILQLQLDGIEPTIEEVRKILRLEKQKNKDAIQMTDLWKEYIRHYSDNLLCGSSIGSQIVQPAGNEHH